MKKFITAAILTIACFSSASAVIDNPGPGNSGNSRNAVDYLTICVYAEDCDVYVTFTVPSNLSPTEIRKRAEEAAINACK